MARKEYYHAHKEQCLAGNRRYNKKNREKVAAYYRRHNLEVKRQVLSHYCKGTPACTICGFDDVKALSIDHIGGGGNEHRRTINGKSGVAFYVWLRKHNYPEGYQVLCMNHQFIKAWDLKEIRIVRKD